MTFFSKIANGHFKYFLLLLFCSFGFLGCSVLDPGPPPSFYSLNLNFPPAQPGPALNCQLAIVEPDSGDMLGSNRLVTKFENGEIKFWANAAWSSPAPLLIQRKLVEAFEATKVLTAMPQDSTGFLADYRLVSDLREFSVLVDQNNQPNFVEVRLAVYIMDLRSGKSVAYLDNPVRVKVNDGSLQSVISAYNQATSQALNEIVLWAIKVLRENNQK